MLILQQTITSKHSIFLSLLHYIMVAKLLHLEVTFFITLKMLLNIKLSG